MARFNDNSSDYTRWSNKRLFERLEETANLKTFCDSIFDGNLPAVMGEESSDVIRERTRLYRESWMQPIIEELKKRILKS